MAASATTAVSDAPPPGGICGVRSPAEAFTKLRRRFPADLERYAVRPGDVAEADVAEAETGPAESPAAPEPAPGPLQDSGGLVAGACTPVGRSTTA